MFFLCISPKFRLCLQNMKKIPSRKKQRSLFFMFKIRIFFCWKKQKKAENEKKMTLYQFEEILFLKIMGASRNFPLVVDRFYSVNSDASERSFFPCNSPIFVVSSIFLQSSFFSVFKKKMLFSLFSFFEKIEKVKNIETEAI